MKIQDAIQLPSEKQTALWDLLSQTDNYPDWHPLIRQLKGSVHFESEVQMQIQIPGSGPIKTSALITGFKEQKYLSFSFFPQARKWWFQCEVIFRIVQNTHSQEIEFVCEIFCYGLKVRFFRASVKHRFQQIADSMTRAIKRQLTD